MPHRGKDSYSIQSVDNALDVLEALCEEGEEVRISRLSEKLGMNKTSVFRLLATFENRGYVEREKSSGKYRLGLSAYEIGQKFLSRMGLLRKARPIMERLARECNEAIYIAVRRGEDVLFLDMVDTTQQVKIVSLVGRRFPLAAAAAGQLLLTLAATTGRELNERNLIHGHLPPEVVKSILSHGSCQDRGALGEGIGSVAVPLFSAGGEVSGALCLIGPEFRMPLEKVTLEFLPRLKEAGEIISSKLGYLGHYLRQEIV